MAINIKENKFEFGIGDKIRVTQKIEEGGKGRSQVFDGIVLAIKNRGENKSFTVRKIGEAGIFIERIFPLFSPTIEKIDVIKKGTSGVNRAKLYYIRGKSAKEIEKIYSRAHRRTNLKK